jgi:hypothetical protein
MDGRSQTWSACGTNHGGALVMHGHILGFGGAVRIALILRDLIDTDLNHYGIMICHHLWNNDLPSLWRSESFMA